MFPSRFAAQKHLRKTMWSIIACKCSYMAIKFFDLVLPVSSACNKFWAYSRLFKWFNALVREKMWYKSRFVTLSSLYQFKKKRKMLSFLSAKVVCKANLACASSLMLFKIIWFFSFFWTRKYLVLRYEERSKQRACSVCCDWSDVWFCLSAQSGHLKWIRIWVPGQWIVHKIVRNYQQVNFVLSSLCGSLQPKCECGHL